RKAGTRWKGEARKCRGQSGFPPGRGLRFGWPSLPPRTVAMTDAMAVHGFPVERLSARCRHGSTPQTVGRLRSGALYWFMSCGPALAARPTAIGPAADARGRVTRASVSLQVKFS